MLSASDFSNRTREHGLCFSFLTRRISSRCFGCRSAGLRSSSCLNNSNWLALSIALNREFLCWGEGINRLKHNLGVLIELFFFGQCFHRKALVSTWSAATWSKKHRSLFFLASFVSSSSRPANFNWFLTQIAMSPPFVSSSSSNSESVLNWLCRVCLSNQCVVSGDHHPRFSLLWLN